MTNRNMIRADMVGSVYFLASGHYIKIGWAADVQRRVKALQCGNPEDLRLLRWIDGTIKDETLWRKRFAHLIVRSEWFVASGELLRAIDRAEEVAEEILADLAEPEMPATWAAYKQSLNHRRRVALASHSKTVTPELVRLIRKDTRPIRTVAAEHGISKTCAQQIRLRQTWTHVGDEHDV